MVSGKKIWQRKNSSSNVSGRLRRIYPSSASIWSSKKQKQPLTTSLVGCFTYNIITSNQNQREPSIKTVIFRDLNITSVPDGREQTEDLTISGHNVAMRWRSLLRRPALSMNFLPTGLSLEREAVSHAPRADIWIL